MLLSFLLHTTHEASEVPAPFHRYKQSPPLSLPLEISEFFDAMKSVGTHKSVTPTVERDHRHGYIITKAWQLTGQVTVVVIA